MASASADDRLAALGYAYIKGPSGDPSDWVLRQTADTSKGFEWKGQVALNLNLCCACAAWRVVLLACWFARIIHRYGSSGRDRYAGIVELEPCAVVQRAEALSLVCAEA